MSAGELYVEGRRYISLETVAELYRVRGVWLREACDQGLLGTPVESGPTLCIAATQLDRVATIVRMHRVLGLDLQAISVGLAVDLD